MSFSLRENEILNKKTEKKLKCDFPIKNLRNATKNMLILTKNIELLKCILFVEKNSNFVLYLYLISGNIIKKSPENFD